MLLLLLTIAFLLPLQSLCGTISSPSGITPIWNSVANANVKAKYIFSFVLETYLSANSQLEVVFPLQYLSSLGTTQAALICTPSCSMSSRSIFFTYPEEMKNGTTYTASVQSILNPSTQGGTANFILRTKRGENIIDENLIFGIIGIAGVIQTMVFGEVLINPTGSLYAGDYTQYILKFKTTTTITQSSYMLFTVPNQFTLEPFPVCSAYEINAISLKGTLFCSQMNQTNEILIEGITGTIMALQEYAIMISMRNPKYAGITDTFKLGIYRANTQMMFEEVDQITGVIITAAQLQNVSMSQVFTFKNSQSRLMDYVIKFTPTFPIPSGCNIKLVFPVYMQIVMPIDFNQNGKYQMHYINYGLEDINEANPIGFYYLDNIQNYLRITNFKEMTMTNEIAVTIRVINPSVSGYTTPLKIYVFQDITEYKLLHSDVLYGIATITTNSAGNQNVASPNPAIKNYYNLPRQGFFPNYIDLNTIPSPLVADQSLIPQLYFNIDPSQTIPQSGFIVLTFPSNFKIATSIINTNCQVYSISLASLVVSAACTVVGQQITMQLPSYSMDIILNPPSETPTNGVNQQKFQINNAVYTPSSNGTYFIDITAYDTDQVTVLDTYSHPILIEANPLTTFSLQNIPITKGLKSILQISFTTLLLIPSGESQYRASDLRGFLEIHFLTNWANDLGTGLANNANIPCYGVNSLIPFSGNSLNCILRIGTATTIPIVVVSNFREIAPNTKVKLMLSGLTNPIVNSNIQIKLFKKQNRIYTLLNQQTATSTVANQPGTTFVGSCSSTPAYSENRVGFLFDLSLSVCIGKSIPANTYILLQLPIYDIGFIRLENTITCSIGTNQVYCIPLYGSDMILMISPITQISMTPSPLFKISNLQWPRYVKSFATSSIKIFVLDNLFDLLQSLSINTITDAIPSQFSDIQVLVPFKGKGFVDASYYFEFTPQADIPQGSTIVLEFPSFYNFLSGGHLPMFSQIGLIDVSTSNTVSIQVNIRLIKITGFQQFNKDNTFSIKAESVKNSDSYNSAIGFNIYVLYQDKLVLQQMSFFQFDFTTPFQAGKLVINQISASIINADEEADYLIQFTPQTDIPNGGIIKVTFPAENYKKLPLTPDCRLSGGINSFSSCILNGNTFNIEINSRYVAGNGIVSLTLKNVNNPDQGTTEGFIISTQFEGVDLDLTDESTLNGRTFTAAKKTNQITVNSILFDPQNEGEEASYKYNFISYSSLNSTSQILFKFPTQYDPILGRDIQCIINGGIIGNSYKCYVTDRIIILDNFDSYSPSTSNPIIVTLFGIVNPNVNEDGTPTNFLKLYIKQQNSNIFDESNSEVSQLYFLKAPGWSPLQSLDVSTYNVRWNSTYNFTFTANSNIPKITSKGSILLDFPSQFEIPDGTITCSSTTTFASSLSCVSYRNRITATGNYYDYVGTMYVRLKQVINPIEQGMTDFLYIRTYDGLNYKIVERNFANLDPFKYYYNYPGPLIIVNQDQLLTIERGTQATNIPISIQVPCVLNLKLLPSQTNYTIKPETISINLGMTEQTFNISVPQTASDGTYIIYWTLDNELDPPIYTPVKRTQIKITKTKTVSITQTTILSIPILGQSLLTEYYLQAAPDTELKVSLYLQKAYFAIKLDTNSIVVKPGQSKFGFTVLYDKSINTNGTQVERGYVTISLSGINSQIFKLTQTNVEFFIISQDTKIPSWITTNIVDIKKTKVQIQIALDEPCMVYYMVALKGTQFPTFNEFQNQIINYNTTQSQFGYQIVYTGNIVYTIQINSLVAETDYSVYLLAYDRGNNFAEQLTLNFTTQTRPNSCYFTLIFNQRTLDSIFIRNVTESLADVFGINKSFIQKQKYYLTYGRRNLQNSFSVQVDEIKSYLDLELAAVDNIESFPDPVDVIAQISSKTSLLISILPTLNLTVEISAIKFVRYIPRFVNQPKIVFIDHQQCAIQFALSNYGWGFAVAVLFQSHTQSSPTPYQIKNGLDYYNRPTPFGKIEVSKSYQDFILNIQGLEAEKDYFIYVIGGSVHFLAPDLMASGSIYQDRIISFQAPEKSKLDIGKGFGSYIQVVFGLLLLILQ